MKGFDSKITESHFDRRIAVTVLRSLDPAQGSSGRAGAGSTRADAFQTDDLELLNQVAAQLATALETPESPEEIDQLKKRLGREKRYLEGHSHQRVHVEGIVGEGRALMSVLDQISVVADSDATVLLLGETGTGKGWLRGQFTPAVNGRTRVSSL